MPTCSQAWLVSTHTVRTLQSATLCIANHRQTEKRICTVHVERGQLNEDSRCFSVKARLRLLTCTCRVSSKCAEGSTEASRALHVCCILTAEKPYSNLAIHIKQCTTHVCMCTWKKNCIPRCLIFPGVETEYATDECDAFATDVSMSLSACPLELDGIDDAAAGGKLFPASR